MIGAYEPMVVLCDGQPRSTSAAAEPDHEALLQHDCYHSACYPQATGVDGLDAGS